MTMTTKYLIDLRPSEKYIHQYLAADGGPNVFQAGRARHFSTYLEARIAASGCPNAMIVEIHPTVAYDVGQGIPLNDPPQYVLYRDDTAQILSSGCHWVDSDCLGWPLGDPHLQPMLFPTARLAYQYGIERRLTDSLFRVIQV